MYKEIRKGIPLGLLCCLIVVSIPAYSINLTVSHSMQSMDQINSYSTTDQPEQITIHFNPNATSLGAGQTVDVEIIANNTGETVVNHLNLTIDTSGFTNESAIHDMTLSIGSLAPKTIYSTSLNFSLPSRESIEDEVSAAGLDLVLLIDGSGSMGEEINAVKSQLNSLLDNLTLGFNDRIRVGAVVYGWNHYSEYPTEDERNYVELGDDLDAIRQFVNQLYAGGGIEPWGDALYVALNMMEWRSDPQIAKMIVQMGDEDCDGGVVVGVGAGAGFYNGSELFDVVNGLKSEGVKIFTVVTEEPEESVIDQFAWISEYTGGETFLLSEGGLTAEDLPRLINEWALNQTHEMIATIEVFAIWQSSIGTLKETTASQIIWIDLTPPDISLSVKVPFTTAPTAAMTVFANVKDVSDITKVTGYWKLPESFWNFTNLEYMGGSSYKLTLPKLPFGSEIQYYIRAWDSCGNEGSTEIFNATIDYPALTSGAIAHVFALNETFAYKLRQLFPNCSYVMWLAANGTTDATLYSGTEAFPPGKVVTQDNTRTMIWTQSESGPDVLRVSSTIETYNEIISVKVTLAEIQFLNLSDPSFVNQSFAMDEEHQVDVFKIIIDENPEALLYEPKSIWLQFPDDSDLVAKIRVYAANWTLLEGIADESGYAAHFTQNGTYYLRIERTFREGNYSFIGYFIDYDPYRSAMAKGEDAASPGFTISLVLMAFMALLHVSKRRKLKKLSKKA